MSFTLVMETLHCVPQVAIHHRGQGPLDFGESTDGWVMAGVL
jgi:hypothetical protein